MYIEVNDKDFEALVSAIGYVVDRKGNVIDETMVDYLSGTLSTVLEHRRNERFGDPGGCASGVATQIEAVLPFIQSNIEGKDE